MPTASSCPLRRKLEHTDFDSDETNSEYSNRFSTAKRTKLDEEGFLSQTTRETAGEPLLPQHLGHTSMDATPPQPDRAGAASPFCPSPPVLRLLLHGVEQSETPAAPSPPLRLTWSTSFSTHRASPPSRLFLKGSSSSTSLLSPPPSPLQPTTLGGSKTSDKVQISNVDGDTVGNQTVIPQLRAPTLSGEQTTKRKRVGDDSDSLEQDPRLQLKPKLDPNDSGPIFRAPTVQSLYTTNTQSTGEVIDGDLYRKVSTVRQSATSLLQTDAPELGGDQMVKRKRVNDDSDLTEHDLRLPQRLKLDSEIGNLVLLGSLKQSCTAPIYQSTGDITNQFEHITTKSSGHDANTGMLNSYASISDETINGTGRNRVRVAAHQPAPTINIIRSHFGRT